MAEKGLKFAPGKKFQRSINTYLCLLFYLHINILRISQINAKMFTILAYQVCLLYNLFKIMPVLHEQ